MCRAVVFLANFIIPASVVLLCRCSYNLDYYSVTKEDTCLLSVTINFDPHVMQVGVPVLVILI
jgi:hypothetical protein